MLTLLESGQEACVIPEGLVTAQTARVTGQAAVLGALQGVAVDWSRACQREGWRLGEGRD